MIPYLRRMIYFLFIKNFFLGIVLSLISLTLSSCSSCIYYEKTGEIKNNIISTDNLTPLSSGPIVYKEYEWRFFSSKEAEKILPASPDEIVVNGEVIKNREGQTVLENYSTAYSWRGFIRYESEGKRATVILSVTRREGQAGHTFDFQEISTEDGTIILRNGRIQNEWIESFPYAVGDCIFSGCSYTIYATVEDVYLPKQMFSGKESVENSIKSSFNTDIRTIFRKDQVFQIIDRSGKVVAVLTNDSYIIYNSLPADKTGKMKNCIGLIKAFIETGRDLTLGRW